MKKIIFGLIFLQIFNYTAKSQNIDPYILDALRYADNSAIDHARASALGISYMGVLNDQASIYYNPAGMSLINKSEVSAGLVFRRNDAITNYYNERQEFRKNTTNLTNLGISAPVKNLSTNENDFYIGVAYHQSGDYYQTQRINGFNPNNTFIQYETSIPDRQWIYDHGLADNGNTPYTDSLYQEAIIFETGGMNNFSFAAAFDLNEIFSIGGNLQLKFGSYERRMEYSETDIYNKYDTKGSQPPYNDLRSVSFVDEYQHDISGINVTVGALANFDDFLRFSVSATTPTVYSIEEFFNFTYRTTFDDNYQPEPVSYDSRDDFGANEFDIITPWIFRAGGSVHLLGLTGSIGIEYIDHSQIQFDNATDDVERLNLFMSEILRGSFKWGMGIEYELPVAPIILRTSFDSRLSEFRNSQETLTRVAGGAGIFVGKGVRVDGMVRYTSFNSDRELYGNQLYDLTVQPLEFSLGLTVRY